MRPPDLEAALVPRAVFGLPLPDRPLEPGFRGIVFLTRTPLRDMMVRLPPASPGSVLGSDLMSRGDRSPAPEGFMLSISVVNDKQNQQLEHESGPLEFGRGPQQDVRRVVIDDVY